MKRRKFFQYAGLGSVGLALTTKAPSLASKQVASDQAAALGIPLETFGFSTTTVDKAGRIKQQKSLEAQFFAESLSPESLLSKSSSGTLSGTSLGSAPLEMVAVTSASHHRGRPAPFFISKYPITQSQWSTVAALPKVQRDLSPVPAHFRGGNLPVESISWVEAVEFCDRLAQYTGRQYQLPTEAQWEYACRAGTQTPFNTGETITSELADYVSTYTYKAEPAGRYRQSTLPVGEFPPNAFGLTRYARQRLGVVRQQLAYRLSTCPLVRDKPKDKPGQQHSV